MKIGAAMFFTEYSMAPGELAPALEERGFDSLWAPEHSHIPLSRASPFPGGGELPRKYHDTMDPFITLTAAAAATRRLLLGTGICLVVQRDPIQTAKLVASIDQVSGGRFLFGVGNGWNADEMANHGTAFGTRHRLRQTPFVPCSRFIRSNISFETAGLTTSPRSSFSNRVAISRGVVRPSPKRLLASTCPSRLTPPPPTRRMMRVCLKPSDSIRALTESVER